MRQAAQLSQRDLAAKLDRPQSLVWRLETGKRRADLLEFAWICNALGRDPSAVYTEIMDEILKQQHVDTSTSQGEV